MIRAFIIPLLFAVILLSCKNQKEKNLQASPPESSFQDTANFFPVTRFIRGEIFEIRGNYKVPLKKVTVKGKTDSAWLKMEDLEKEFADFLTPEIDSANLKKLYSQTSFMDQTINAVTLTYDPLTDLPADSSLIHWDVYINPETGKVKRVYLLKKNSKGQTLQLTWETSSWCKIVTLVDAREGKTEVESETIFNWDY